MADEPSRSSRFRDRFAAGASQYAAFRPRYPDALFIELARAAPSRRLAWDCATGSGQAASGLARHFDCVIGTDASFAQLARAPRQETIRWVQAVAEAPALASGRADLVTVAQALHWLDRPAFFEEARRVLRPRGVVAVWSYGMASIDPLIDPHLVRFHDVVVGPYWDPERALALSGYAGIEFPFEEIAVAGMAIRQPMTLAQLGGYLSTWSATLRYRSERGEDPVEPFVDSLRERWGDPRRGRLVSWPLSIRAGRTGQNASR